VSASQLHDVPTTTSATTVNLLTRIAVAFSRRRAYPETHPLVRTAETQAFDALSQSLTERPIINLSVGSDGLLVDGTPVHAVGNVAHDLAERLRNRGIGAISLDRAATAQSLSEAFRFLATEPEAGDDGSLRSFRPPTLDGIAITRLAYGRLMLGSEVVDPHAQAADIWRLLATAALLDDADPDDGVPVAAQQPTDRLDPGGERSHGDRPRGDHPTDDRASGDGPTADREADDANTAVGATTAPVPTPGNEPARESDDVLANADPSSVAQAIERRLPRVGYAKRVAFVLLRVADQVAQAPPDLRAMLGERLRNVLMSLETSSIGTIIRSVGVGDEQRKFMGQMIDALPAAATIEWLERTAGATGETLSPHLLRLLSKLSDRVETSPLRAASETAFRGAAQDLVRGWTLDDPNPNAHALLLNQIWQHESTETANALPDPGTARLVQIALEIDESFVDAEDAAHALIADGQVASLLQWIEEAPGRAAAASIESLMVSPAAVRSVLLRDPLDVPVARTLLSSLDLRATDVLLEVLRDAEGRATRRLVYDRLRELGSGLVPHLIPRLDGAPWYFVRNLLALLRDTSGGQDGSAASAALLRSFLDHPQEQVRLEALRLLVADAETRDTAIRQALDDRSERVIGAALELLATESSGSNRRPASSEVGRRLLRFVETDAHTEALQARAVRALAHVAPAASIRDALLGLVSRRTWLAKRLALSEPKPVMLAALEVLALRYASDPQSGQVLDLALRDDDTRIRSAAQPHASSSRGGASR